MNTYVKLNDGRYLVAYPVEAATTPVVSEPTNFIWIYDRSGSMCSELPQLINDLCAKSKQIKHGDSLTIGWFSGEGQYEFFLKGFKITSDSDYVGLEKLIRQNARTVGCTCFSEVLTGASSTIKDLANIFGNKYSLVFFTDGYPCVSNYNKEIAAILNITKQLKVQLSSAVLVGYGNYYNKPLMSEMAENMNGTLIHASSLMQFSLVLENFLEGASTVSKVKVPVPYMAYDALFSIHNDEITSYKPENGNVEFIRKHGDKDYLYAIQRVPGHGKEVKSLARGKSNEYLLKGLYASAIVFSQKTKSVLALQCLAKTGDIECIDMINNSFTNADYNKAEEYLGKLMTTPSLRLKKGRDFNYLPDPNAFCMVDLLELLGNDPDAKFYPRHKQFQYNRIGVAAKVLGDYPKFNANENSACAFSSLTWNDELLNLSVLARIEGNIELPENELGLAKKYPTFIFRNYAIIKDGMVNTAAIPMSCSEATYKTLKEKGLVSGKWDKHEIFILKLDDVPVMNTSMANDLSAISLCGKIIQEFKIKAYQKVLKSYLLDETKSPVTLNEKQQEFLLKYGINPKSGAFEAKTEAVPPTDHYMAKAFCVKVSGFSALPKVSEVEDRMKAGKTLNASAKCMAEAIEFVNKSPIAGMDKTTPVAQTWIQQALKDKQKELQNLRYQIQKTKFAIILGKHWFTEFDSRENNVITIDEISCALSVKEVKVDI